MNLIFDCGCLQKVVTRPAHAAVVQMRYLLPPPAVAAMELAPPLPAWPLPWPEPIRSIEERRRRRGRGDRGDRGRGKREGLYII